LVYFNKSPKKNIKQNNFFKSTVNHFVFVDASKITKDTEFKAENNYSKCNSCGVEKEIVFEREGFKLCDKCLDEFMREHRFRK
jgi:hypothetical protein